MIEVNKLTKHFGDVTALDDLSLHVPKGAIYGLVGPNGAGKSTLIRHLSGVYKPDAGEILIQGQSVYENEEVKKNFTLIPDEIFYFTQSTIHGMMRFYQGLYPKFDQELFKKIIECFPAMHLKKQVRSLSKGMQKQLAFALAIATRTELMILDEPVDGLDPVMRRQIWNFILADVAEHGLTVLVSSHNLRELEDVCDHVGIMNQGRLLLEKSLDELQESLVKVQIAFAGDMPALPDYIKVLRKTSSGRVHTLIVRGEMNDIKRILSSMHPLIMDILPLSLEEIFIYELGDENYAVKDIIF